MPTPVIHLIETLRLGGDAGVMLGLAASTTPAFAPAIAGVGGDETFVRALCQRGMRAALVGEDLAGLSAWVEPGQPFAVMIHRAGAGTPLWQRLLPALQERGARVILAWNHFSEVDMSEAAPLVDAFCFGSRDSLYRHWVACGRPDPEIYLRWHLVLHCPIRPQPGAEVVQAQGAALRKRLGIAPDAFVIGDVCRPAPEKLDWMLVDVFRRLQREIPGTVALTRRFPDPVAEALTAVAPEAVHHLPLTSDASEMTATYGALDVLTHFSTMGESFGMAIAEALACGVPVVANETPRPRCDNAQGELVLDERTGYLANDPATAVAQIMRIAREPHTRKHLSENARHLMRTPPLNPESIRERFEGELIRQALDKDWDIPDAPTPHSRCPSNEEITKYLHTYKRGWNVPPAWPLRPWVLLAELRRHFWRLRRRWT